VERQYDRAHFIHLPFFVAPRVNRAYAHGLSAVLGIPQSLWRARHLRHHAGHERPIRWTRDMRAEAGTIVAVWTVMAWVAPRWFVSAYVPGYLAGLGCCWLQGHFEHAGGTTSHYSAIYNLFFFNDGYHVEHHLRPAEHWTRIRRWGRRDPRSSRWPPVLRWIERVTPGQACTDNELGGHFQNDLRAHFAAAIVVPGLGALEHMVLRSRVLQQFVLARHERAFRALLPGAGPARRVTIVGGGLFPRTPLLLSRLLPMAEITVIDASSRNIDIARRFLDDRVRCACGTYDPRAVSPADLVVIPLAYSGNRRRLYDNPPAPAMLVHDWIWSRRGRSVVISWLLLKRLSLVRA
jgi:hypothetical protein